MSKIPSSSELEEKLLSISTATDIGMFNKVLEVHKDRNPDKFLTAADIKHDTSVLARILIRVWGAWPFFGKIEKRMILTGLLKIYDNASDMSARQYFELLRPIIAQVPDKHIVLTLRDCNAIKTTRGHKNKNVGKNIVSSCFGNVNWESEDIDSTQSIKTELRGDKIAVCGMSLMCRSVEFGQELEKMRDILPNSRALIIDLRGNGGGSDRYSSRFADCLCGANVRANKKVYVRSTPDARRVHSVFLDGIDWNKLNTDTDPVMWRSNKNVRANIANGYAKPIYILIDGHVASSAEIFVLKMAHHPMVKFIGDNTSGCEENGYVCNLFLPNSFIRVRPGQLHRELEYPNFETNGFAPDIRVPDGDDAMRVAMADIELQAQLKINQDSKTK